MCHRTHRAADPGTVRAPIDLDHIGLGVHAAQPELELAVTRFGATVIYGGYTPGCHYVVTRMGDADRGIDVEFLEPERADEEPFLERFLAQRGPGAHHVTFIVADLASVLDRFAEAGLAPVVRRDFEHWREAFFTPAQVGGIVVQLGELAKNGPGTDEAFARAREDEPLGAATTERRGWEPGTAGWWEWPGPRGEETAVLTRIVLASDDLDRGLAVFAGLLGGELLERSADAAELSWPRGGRLRLERRDDRRPGFLRLDILGAPAGVDRLAGAAVSATSDR